MRIQINSLVRFDYQITDRSGNVVATSHNTGPIEYLHGHMLMLPGVEEALEGKQAGDKISKVLAPEQAFGNRLPNASQRIPVQHLKNQGPLEHGSLVFVDTDSGPRPVTVIEAGEFMVTVDVNHPLAGKHLRFDLTVRGVGNDAQPSDP